jgi:hypothetical protein
LRLFFVAAILLSSITSRFLAGCGRAAIGAGIQSAADRGQHCEAAGTAAQGLTLASVPVGDNGYKLQRAGAAAMGKANGVYHYALQNAF